MSTVRFALIVLGFTLFALVDGLVLGVIAGMVLHAPPSSAPVIDTDDYVTLVAVSFAQDSDLAAARNRLTYLNEDTVILGKLLADVAARARPADSSAIAALSSALPAQSAPVIAADARSLEPTSTPTLVLKPSDTPPPPAQRSANLAPPPTATRTATPIRAPTATRTRTRTPTPVRKAATATPTTRPIVAAPATNTPPAAPGVNYRIKLVRRLTACENGGNHHMHVLVLDAAGNGLAGKPVEFVWSTGSFVDTTGKKIEYIPFLGVTAQTTPGYVNYPLYRGSYRAKVLDGVSEQTGWLNVDIGVDEYCAANDNPQGNSLYHYSYLVVFQRTR
jgi:hypothetical protein